MKSKTDKRFALRLAASSSLSTSSELSVEDLRAEGPSSRPLRAKGFTLVELLVVISIIILLAGILVPSLDYARTFAKSTSSKALIHTLSAGLDMYKIETKLGKVYPPSTGTLNTVAVDGAQTLVLALAGQDLLGTKGFPNGNVYDSNTSDPSFGPFIDISKTTISSPNTLKNFSWNGSGGNPSAPVVVDAFNWPVLYFEPNASGSYVESDNTHFLTPSRDPIADSGKFAAYIQDYRVANLTGGTYKPYNSDSYILISAGPDKKYGTADDVDNFDPSAQLP